MSEEKLYAVKNDKGEWLSFDSSHESVWDTNNPTFFKDKSYAEAQSMGRRAHVVELVEAPAKVVVSGKESEILKKLDCEIRTKSTGYSPWKWLSKLDDLGMAVEDAYKALALGWKVEKPKRYVLPMEGMDSQAFTTSKRTVKQYCYLKDGHWDFWPAWDDKDAAEKGHTVTQADINVAPAWVKSITPVEVTDDDD